MVEIRDCLLMNQWFPMVHKPEDHPKNPAILRGEFESFPLKRRLIFSANSSTIFQKLSFFFDGHRSILNWLVVWLPSILFSHSYWVAIIIPIAELIFFRGVAQPPTSTWYMIYIHIYWLYWRTEDSPSISVGPTWWTFWLTTRHDEFSGGTEPQRGTGHRGDTQPGNCWRIIIGG